METIEKPAVHCETCVAPLYRGQVAIEGGITHDLVADPPRSRRAFYCSQDCADYIRAAAPVSSGDEDVCNVCGQAYSKHCSQCYCCPGTHDENCGW